MIKTLIKLLTIMDDALKDFFISDTFNNCNTTLDCISDLQTRQSYENS